MPYENPIVAGTALVRSAIKSPNYTPGVAGWSINRSGSAEFSDATIRGTVRVLGSDGSEVDIEPVGGNAQILLTPAPSLPNTFGPAAITAAGFGGPSLILTSPINNNVATTPAQINITGGAGVPAAITFNAQQLFLGSGVAWEIDGADLSFQSRSMPRGLLSRVDSVTPSGALAAETVVLTTPSMVFAVGRAYELRWYWVSAQTAAGLVNVKARVGTTIAGANRASWALPHNSTLTTTDQGFAYVKNATGVPVTTPMVLTAQPGAGTVAVGGVATTVQVFEVWDVGAAGDFANAIQI